MTTAKEIADAFRSAPLLQHETHPALPLIWQRIYARNEAGAPCVVEYDVLAKFNDARRALMECRAAVTRSLDKLTTVARSINECAIKESNGLGYWTPDDNLSAMNTQDPAALLALARVAVDALWTSLALFAAIGDRIEATTDEQAKAAAERAERETVIRRTAWEKLPAAALRKAAITHGISYGSKADACAILAERGLLPASE